MSLSRVSFMLVWRGEESSTRATISSLMALITNSRRSEGGEGERERWERWFHNMSLLNVSQCFMNKFKNQPYSVLSPHSFTLLASYWAFFFKRQALKKKTKKNNTTVSRHGGKCHPSAPHLLFYCGCNRGVTHLDASLFFSLRERGRAVSGSSLTGVRSLITLFSLRSSVPICSNLRGLGVKSSTSVRRDFFNMYFP